MPTPPKIDFIHIGYHKTASTWLQKRVFPCVPGLLMCNDNRFGLERPFIDSFIQTDPFRFDKSRFLEFFAKTIERGIGDVSRFSLFGISDENLSGGYLTGMDSRLLADRLLDTFGTARILIVVRNQLDMLLSFYSAYIVHGGVCAFADMPRDANVNGRRVLNKLKYSGMIEYYRKLFGANKVTVVFFEALITERHPLRQLFEDLGVKEGFPESPPEKENRGRSLAANGIMRQLNRLGVNRRYGQHFAQLFSFDRREADREQVRKLFPNMIEEWREDNRRLAELLKSDLPPAYAL
jgi:hypothetical protein